ncbi:threonine/serine exporter family protein [bacterium]|nr:threonine/serine exporter family protein [bacterium]
MTTLEEAEKSEAGSESACRVADLLLDLGAVLLVSGAHCGRVSRNLERVAEQWGYQVDLFMSFTGLSVTLRNEHHPVERINRFRRCPLPGVHFGIVTEISLLTWRVCEQNLEIDEVEERMAAIKKLPHHPRWLTLLGTGAACACLCMLAGGNQVDGGIAFAAATCGLFARQEIVRMRFNPMISIIVASFVTTVIAGSDAIYQFGLSPEKALATSVLYLVPGVPLINCVIDLIEGYIPTAVARGIFGGFILLCIAVGMSLAILLLGIHHFHS